MSPSEILQKDPRSGQTISHSSEPSEQTLELLKATVWGSRDTRYRVLGIAEKLARLRNPSFFVLEENGTELCVFVLDHCHKFINGTRCGAYHFVMASTLEGRRGEGLATRLIDVIRPYAERTVGQPGLGFAYVEETTEITLKISEHTGHSVEADIPLQLFSRLRPRPNDRVGRICDTERDAILQMLKSFYADHELSDFSSSFRPEETYVHRRNGDVTASLQAELLNWQIVSMPGAFGVLLLKIMPKIPGWNSFLNLSDLRVLRFGNICFDADRVQDVFALAEACLAMHGARVGLIMLDKRSPVLAALRTSGDFGLLSRAMKGNAKLHIDTVSMPQPLLLQLQERPLLVSPADVF